MARFREDSYWVNSGRYADYEEPLYNVYCTYDDGSGGETDGDPRNRYPIPFSKLKVFCKKLVQDFLDGKLKGSYRWVPITTYGEKGKFYLAESGYEKFVGEGYNEGFTDKGYYGYRYDDEPAPFNTREEAERLASEINSLSFEEQRRYRFNEGSEVGVYQVVEDGIYDDEVNELEVLCSPLVDSDEFTIRVNGDGEIIEDDLGIKRGRR